MNESIFLVSRLGLEPQDPLIKSQMLYRPELTAHLGGCRNMRLLQANAVLGSTST